LFGFIYLGIGNAGGGHFMMETSKPHFNGLNEIENELIFFCLILGYLKGRQAFTF